MAMDKEIVKVIAESVSQLTHVGLTAYVVRIVTKEMFQYLNHRLDVLGKDAFLVYPKDRYRPTEDGRVLPLRELEDQ